MQVELWATWELPLKLHDFYFAGTFEAGVKTYRRWQGLLTLLLLGPFDALPL
jgi:hypothetical protein